MSQEDGKGERDFWGAVSDVESDADDDDTEQEVSEDEKVDIIKLGSSTSKKPFVKGSTEMTFGDAKVVIAAELGITPRKLGPTFDTEKATNVMDPAAITKFKALMAAKTKDNATRKKRKAKETDVDLSALPDLPSQSDVPLIPSKKVSEGPSPKTDVDAAPKRTKTDAGTSVAEAMTAFAEATALLDKAKIKWSMHFNGSA